MKESKESINQMVEYALLYDFYGALLKDKNGKIFEAYMFNDMSLAEIADEEDITRQGVSDIVRRSGKKLIEYEERLGLIRRFKLVKGYAQNVKKDTEHIRECIDRLNVDLTYEKEIFQYLDTIKGSTDCILDEL